MPDDNNFISAIKGYLRLGDFPLDAKSLFQTQEAAEEYASTDPTAYAGQLVAVATDPESETRSVTIYQIGYKTGGGLELQSLVASQVGTVKSINGILPDENGNVVIDLDHIDFLLTFLEETETRVVFSKMVQVDTESIAEDDDVVTKGYLEASNEAILTFTVPKSTTGMPTLTFDDARKTSQKNNKYVYVYDESTSESEKIPLNEIHRPSSFVIDSDPETESAASNISDTKIGDFVYIKEE